MWCGYSKLVPGDVWQDEKWIRTILLYWIEKTSKMWSKLTIFVVFLTLWAFTMNWMNILTWILKNLVRHLLTQVKSTNKCWFGSKWPVQAQKWPKKIAQNGQFSKILACMWCGDSKLDHFCFFSDLLDVYYDTNEHIDMNPIKSYPTSPGTSLEYPHHIHASIFENWPFWAIFAFLGHIWACTSHLEPTYPLLVL